MVTPSNFAIAFPNHQPPVLGFKVADLAPDLKTLIKSIVATGGYIQEADLITLAAQLPTAQVVVKWCNSPRTVGDAKVALENIQSRAKIETDFPREVFFSAGICDVLQKAL